MTVVQPPRDLDHRMPGAAPPTQAQTDDRSGTPSGALPEAIDGFLHAAFEHGVVDDVTFHDLEAFLAEQASLAVQPSCDEQPSVEPLSVLDQPSTGPGPTFAPTPASMTPPIPTPPTPAAAREHPERPIWETVRPRRDWPASPSRVAPPSPRERPPVAAPSGVPPEDARAPAPPTQPAEPGPVALAMRAGARHTAAMARVVAADVALHGFVYLGLLLTFVGLLGFLLFSFKDVPTDVQPVIEFAVPVVLFTWSWVLHRQRAVRVAQAMELLGGIILPLVVFAALVDGAPFPPDAQGGTLVVAMVAVCIAGAGLYASWSRRRPDSVLRYLVHPMLWLGAMALGFAAKTDEPLLGDAITRLVSLQPALAAAAVAASLAWIGWRPGTRLAAPTRVAALPGSIAAYGLTLGLAAGEGWTRLWPVVVAGAATLVTAELLAVQFDRRSALVVVRPLLLVATIAPLVPIVGAAWAGVVAVVAFLGLAEASWRRTPVERNELAVAVAGVAVGTAMAMAEPWTGVLAWSLVTLWTTGRLALGTSEVTLVRPLAVAAAVAPVGLAGSLLAALPHDLAWVAIASLLLVVAIGVRWRGAGSAAWGAWSAAAGVVVALGVVVSVDVLGTTTLSPTLLAVAALGAAAVVTLATGWAVTRLWAVSAILVVALALALVDLPVAASSRPVVWGAVALTLVAMAALRRSELAPHLAAVGHLVAVGAIVLAADETVATADAPWPVLAVVVVGSTLGWFVAVLAQELGRPTVADLLHGRTSPDSAPSAVAPAWSQVRRSLPAAFLLLSLPFSWLLSLAELPAVTARPAWVGSALAALALAEAIAARATAERPALRPVVAPSAAVLAVAGVVAGAEDVDVLLLTALGAIATAVVLGRRLAVLPFVWFAWLQSGLVVVLLAERTGMRPERLPTVVIVWAASLLVGGLAVDDRSAGRRPAGGWIRQAWLRAPVVLGAVGLLLAYGLLVAQAAVGFEAAAPTRLGWWSLVVAGIVLVVALQLRLAALSGLTALLTTVGLALLSPWPVADDPWVLVVLAAALAAASWVLARVQPETNAPAVRWDLPPLVVAHLVAGAGLVHAVTADAVAATWLPAGALAAALAVWRRHRAWAEGANVLLLVGAAALGAGWPTLAFAGTAIRGIVATTRTEGTVRWSYQVIGVLGAGAGWLSLVAWAAWSAPQAIVRSALASGTLAVAVALLRRAGRMAADTMTSWAGLAVAAQTITLVSLATVLGDVRPVGLAPAIGVALVAIAASVTAPVVSARLHDVAAGLVVIAWLLAIAGTGWEAAVASMATTAGFALVALVVVEVARRRAPAEGGPAPDGVPARRLARTWCATAAAAVAFGALLARGALEPQVPLLVLAGALVVLAVAAARGPNVLGWPQLRYVSGLLLVAAAMVGALALEATITWLTLLLLALGLAVTLTALVVWRAVPTHGWLQPLVTAGLTASAVAGMVAVTEPSDPALVVVLVAYAAQAAAVGLVLRRPAVLALAPVFAVAGWAVLLVELPVDGTSWLTVPIAVALLAEVDVARWGRRRSGQAPTSRELLTLELAAIGLAVVPPLTELFTRGLATALVALVLAAGLLVWGVVTRVRRRAVAAAALATATAVLTIAAAAAGQAPASAFVWIVMGGVGITLLLVVALVEATRSRGGRGLRRLDELTADWE
jgi:hypothetical protein